MSGKLHNKVAVITGGTTGIGLATAKRFVAEGAKVIITGTNPKTIESARAELGGDVDVLASDASDGTAVKNLFEQVREKHGKIDVLFLNAGIARFAPWDQHSEEDFVNREYPQMIEGLLEKAKVGDTIGLRRSNVWKYASPIGLHRNAHALVDVDDSLIDQFCALSIPRTFVYGEKSVPSNADEAGADAPFPDKLRAHGVNTKIVPNAGHGLMFDNLGGFVDILSKIAF